MSLVEEWKKNPIQKMLISELSKNKTFPITNASFMTRKIKMIKLSYSKNASWRAVENKIFRLKKCLL
jgi:hypothetical protein